MRVKFAYAKDCTPDEDKQKIITSICTSAARYLRLPDTITVQLLSMGNSTYGETVLDPRMLDTIRINHDLSLNDFIYPVCHELIHLDQIVTGRLSATKSGKIYWEGCLYTDSEKEFEQYQKLPWEEDVTIRIEQLIKNILDM